MEFVAKVPTWSYTGAFSSVGTYYFARYGTYHRIEKAAELIGYAWEERDKLGDLSEKDTIFTEKIGHGSDMVVVFADVEGTGEAEYIMTLQDAGKLRVTRTTGEFKSWLLQSKPELDTNNRSYGAAWAYQNRVFFSQNKAGGMFEVLTNTIDLVSGTVIIEKIGPSFDLGATDGANCINKEIPSKFSGRCGPKVGAYSAITKDDPFPAPGATNVRPNQELIFLPSHDDTVTGYQVFLGPATLNTDGSVASVEWHLQCNLKCGVNVCRPPYSLDNTLGGNFAWRVDFLKADGSTVTGETWQFSLMKTVTYDTRAVADTYINKKPDNWAKKRHMLMRSRTQKNPHFGFVKFLVPPPTYAGVGDCKVSVLKAKLRLTVLSVRMEDVLVYLVSDFDENDVTSATGKHPGSGEYPDVFNSSVLVNHAMGPVDPKESFTIDVTSAVSEVFEANGESIAFGLETNQDVSRFCAQRPDYPRNTGWCYPALEVLLGIGDCNVSAQDPSCSKPAGSTPGPLDDMCGSTEPTFPGTATDWRKDSVITTTTTTTTTTMAAPIKDGQCRYNDHVYCPWPNSNIMCAGDQCCPDQSTCPSSKFGQAQGCNLKKYDCTASVPANWTCRETEEVFCPGTTDKCSGDTCCPNNTTCPSASVQQLPSCGSKAVDCQAPLSEDFSCAIGEFVFCPASDSNDATLSSAPAKECSAHPKCVALGLTGDCCPMPPNGVLLDCCDAAATYRNDKCAGNQCCPDGSTCPSAPAAIAEGCGPKKQTCELLAWDVKLVVTSIAFAQVEEDSAELTQQLVTYQVASSLGVDSTHVDTTLSPLSAPGGSRLRRLTEKGMIINAKVSAPGGWSQKKFDSTVEEKILSEDAQLEMEEMLSEIDGLQEASSGDMVFEPIKAEREEPEGSTSPPPQSVDSSTESPSMPSDSLDGGDGSDMAQDQGTETSSATTCSSIAALLFVVSICSAISLFA